MPNETITVIATVEIHEPTTRRRLMVLAPCVFTYEYLVTRHEAQVMAS